MRLDAPSGSHLTYCTNIHPGESRAEVLEMLRTLVPDVKLVYVPRQKQWKRVIAADGEEGQIAAALPIPRVAPVRITVGMASS